MTASYEDLKRKREREWAEAQAYAAKQRDLERARISRMPDVMNRPPRDIEWSHPGITCDCGAHAFYPEIWSTLNGIKHRVQTRCANCQRRRTWDWSTNEWCD